MRIDKYLTSTYPSFSRRQIRKFITEGRVTVAGKSVDPDFDFVGGADLRVDLPTLETPRLEAQDVPLKVVDESENFLVIDKPAGLVVHPGAGHRSGTVVNGLLAYLGKKSSEDFRVGVVHRLDKDTSGLLLLAKNETVEKELKRRFKDREVKKEYLALVSGRMDQPAGEINKPLGRHPRGGLRFAIGEAGKQAVTRYFTEKTYPVHTLLRVVPITGRTHQIRVHLKSIGHPVVGDSLYGGEKAERLFLHATRLSFRLDGRDYEYESELPENLNEILQRIGKA